MKLKVLIIEDETIVALHIKKTILMLGHEVIRAVKNSVDALGIAKKTKIDLVISDININGDMDGIECCQVLQSKHNIPVIFITAYRDVNTLRKASQNVKFIGYLVKPFREDELETMIELAIIEYDLLSKKTSYVINDKYCYCYKTNKLLLDNNPVILTKKEHEFLLLLIEANGLVVSYELLELKLWNDKYVEENSRRQFIHRFKKRAPSFPLILVKGIGYKLDI